MKKSIVAAAIFLIIGHCNYAQTGPAIRTCLSVNDAEKILGQAAVLTESNSEKIDGIFRLRCIYTAKDTDRKTGKKGNIYYMAEEYPSEVGAHDTLAKFSYSNRNAPGWKNITGIADEAISHTDKRNFELIIVRKGTKMIRMKVTKLTALTAPIETLLSFGGKIVSTI